MRTAAGRGGLAHGRVGGRGFGRGDVRGGAVVHGRVGGRGDRPANIAVFGEDREVIRAFENEEEAEVPVDGAAPAVGGADRADWSETNVGFLIDAIMEQVPYRTAEGNSFKPTEWTIIVENFNHSTGRAYTKLQCQSKLSSMKSDYEVWKHCLGNSGFGFDNVNQIPTAPDNVWDAYLLQHPKAAPYRFRTLFRKEELETIFQGRIATGVYAQGSAGIATPGILVQRVGTPALPAAMPLPQLLPAVAAVPVLPRGAVAVVGAAPPSVLTGSSKRARNEQMSKVTTVLESMNLQRGTTIIFLFLNFGVRRRWIFFD